MPRGPHDSHGLSTTRAPLSSLRPTTSCPSTCGNDTSAVSGLSLDPFSRICFTSEPHSPENVVRTRTQPAAGSGGSATSSRRAGANLDTNARRSTRPPMAEAASRARLCRNTSAVTPPSFEPVRAVRHGTMAGPAVPAGWTSAHATWATKLRIATVAQRRRIASSSPAPEGPGCAR